MTPVESGIDHFPRASRHLGIVRTMSESVQSSGKHGSWLDDALARHPRDDDETTVPDLFNTPGHDGIVSEDESDPDRVALRSEIGKYVSLAHFPATAQALTAAAERNRAPDTVLDELRGLSPMDIFTTAHDVWRALDLTVRLRF
jgi:hypothetical protein